MYFESKVEIPLMRYGNRQRIEALINEEALLLAKYLRFEKKGMESKNLRPTVVNISFQVLRKGMK